MTIAESQAVLALLAQAQSLSLPQKEARALAESWVQGIRAQKLGHGVEAFLQAYALDTEEGIALMCLAEALLRIPDRATADALIHTIFADKEWDTPAQGGDAWMGAVKLGLRAAGGIVELGEDAENRFAHLLGRTAARLGMPVLRTALRGAMRVLGNQFVLGETLAEALEASEPYETQGYRFSYDILGEGARSDAQALGYVQAYLEGIERIGARIAPGTALFDAPGISVKLSALHPRYSLVQRGRVMRELLPRLKQIALAARHHNIAVSIDAEEAARLDIELHVFEALLADADFTGWNGLGFVVQAYQKRAPEVIEKLAELARAHSRILPLRLVKGAYWDAEIKLAQMQGLHDYPVFTRKEHTDLSYLVCAADIVARRGYFYPQFATHNAHTLANVILLAERQGLGRGEYEIQRLFGMGEALHGQTLARAPSRIYAPVGQHKDLLAYLIRRLLENGANSSFVHKLTDAATPVAELLADPVAHAAANGGAPNPAIPLPMAIYGDTRRNSRGVDFGNETELEAFLRDVRAHAALPAPPKDAAPHEIGNAAAAAHAAFPGWAAQPVETRVKILLKAAELIEAHLPELVSLCAREAGRTLADGVAEVREAADFCRYYAAEARRILTPQPLPGPTGESNRLSLHARGVFACISPWNFPLAIFTGQVAAALVTGNTALAKPAGQTPRMAARAVALLHEAGVPRDVLQLIPGDGDVGAALVRDARVDGVVFTGSVETARNINRALAERDGPIAPLIAETGGQNCMIVDSSALPEQAVDDILLSAFGSAGQRCSALRVLYVQEEIADELLALLADAMQELALGDPLDPATDIGPVIDAPAKAMLEAHIADMRRRVRFIASTPLKVQGNFVAPHLFEIPDIALLQKEVFGPVLHVIRFRTEAMEQVCDAINATGYGLTFGIHSRIQERIDFFTSRVRAGNLYVNRGMTGAVVGVQPFGGQGLSGTGPKAGGPHYLGRFLTERTLTVNTAAIGGNATLLSG